MSYRLAGRATDFCGCNTPCPCAFGQEPTSGTCKSVIFFDIQEGELDGLDLSGTKAVLISTFDGVWTAGNFTAALVLDENASEEQRAALAKIYGGELGGDGARRERRHDFRELRRCRCTFFGCNRARRQCRHRLRQFPRRR